ncbi:hypothetical protein CK203_032243 [Vitis vinifera]|uniref:Uncharacterized protein n=1 Tax=Vitis vinifera TaxID=29760 RepID=A0A438IPL7_VITVI|nr:hypothetical protein CK203_032243 [Vitis vinifera]
MSCSLVRSLGVGRFLEWGALDSRGMAGGVGVWPVVGRFKGRFQGGVGDNQGIVAGSVVHRGDFNVIRFMGERNMYFKTVFSNERFSEIMEDLELRDLPLQGGLSCGGFKVFYLDLFLTTAQFCWTVEERRRAFPLQKDSALKEMMFWDSIEMDRVLYAEEQNLRKQALGGV